jgi:hypothetical protein
LEIAIVVAFGFAELGFTEDKRTFSTFGFIQNKVGNRLGGHLGTCVRMFSQGLWDLESFPFKEAIGIWHDSKVRVRAHH